MDKNKQDRLGKELLKHSEVSKEHMMAAMEAIKDPKERLIVLTTLYRIAELFGKEAMPPDNYLATTLHILANGIEYANEEVGVPEACRLMRGLDNAVERILKHGDSDVPPAEEKDPWAA